MLFSDEIIIARWSHANKDHYEKLGYTFTKYKDEFEVKATDLYFNSHIRITAKCDLCGKENSIACRDYYKNTKSNNGIYVCHPCSTRVMHNKTLEQRRNDYINRLELKCLDNGYTLLSCKDEISNNTSKIRYMCPRHGEQSMRISNFLNDKKCPLCNKENSRNAYQLSTDEIINRVKTCGGKVINPEEYVNQDTRNLKFICPECGNEFITSLQKYLQHGGMVCSECNGKESLGEKKIRYYLEDHNIEFVQQKWFQECRDIHPLPFDFFLPSLNTIIEFDGRQHFTDTNLFSYPLEKTVAHDKIKNEYCNKNNIDLIRIPYTKINHINDILDNKLFA